MVAKALAELEKASGFVERPSQKQLAFLIDDLIAEDQSGLFEAPTGVGKSLAALIPAFAQAAANGKRVVIATYTNVLAEQYWAKDVPFIVDLFAKLTPVRIDIRLLMGRQRYCCLKELEANDARTYPRILKDAKIGHETEIKRLLGLPPRTANAIWQKVATPVVCPGRLCSDYNRCYYYSARRAASKAGVIITNHSVVIQDAIMKAAAPSEGLLGDYDFLILDEAHDFPLAATNGLEFEITPAKLQSFTNIGLRLNLMLRDLADTVGASDEWSNAVKQFDQDSVACLKELQRIGMRLQNSGIVAASPAELQDHELVKRNRTNLTPADISELGQQLESCCKSYSRAIDHVLTKGSELASSGVDGMRETIRNYRRYLDEFAGSVHALIAPKGISVTHASSAPNGTKIRFDTIGIAEPLNELIWKNTPTACLSATLTVDESFDFFRNATGLGARYEEVLPSPFDYSIQTALYLPPAGTIPDPTETRKSGTEAEYYRALANEIRTILRVCEGRTLVLFHSRKEMEAVADLVPSTTEFPILVQSTQSSADQGEQFKKHPQTSLFALRSFWTGFDAPGPTLSCVVLVRIPFEVPVDPPQIARAAHLQLQGLNPFAAYALPMAKMLVRQGAGRLIRTPEDQGIIAILDPRIQTKRYGEEFLTNLPPGIQTFSNIEEAAGHIQLSPITTTPQNLFENAFQS